MYLATLGPAGALVSLRMVPIQVKRMRLQRASADDAAWMARVLTSAGARFGTRVERGADGTLVLRSTSQPSAIR